MNFDGMLDRGDYCWNRVHELRGEVFHGFGVDGPDGLEGYIFVAERRKPETGRYDVAISDLAFTSARAGRRMAALLGDMATVGDEAILFGGPWHPLLALLPQQNYLVERRDYWMLRIVCLPEAMKSRGYVTGVRGPMRLHVLDPIVSENQGTWHLADEGGVRCDRVGEVDSTGCSIAALAPLYSGLTTAAQARTAGFEAEGAEFPVVSVDDGHVLSAEIEMRSHPEHTGKTTGGVTGRFVEDCEQNSSVKPKVEP